MRAAGLVTTIALASTLALAGCTQAITSFACTDNASCRNGSDVGTCQPNGACSFADASCTSGQRYGAASGTGIAGVCVGDEPTGDGGITPPPMDTLMPFTTTQALPVGSYTNGSAVHGGRLYVVGGILGSTARDQVYVGTVNTAAIEPQVALQDAWMATTPLPAPRRNHGVAISGNHLFVTGGRPGTAGSSTDVLSAPILTDGSVGTWTSTTAMPFPIRCAPAVATPAHLYVIGGKENGSVVTDRVLFAPISDGSAGTWALAGRLPVALACPTALVHNGHLLVVGGCASSGQSACSSVSPAVYLARIRADGGLDAFTNLTPMPEGRWHHTAAIGNGFLYVLGGAPTDAAMASTTQVLAAPLNADNTLGSWSVSRPLVNARTRPSAQVVGDFLFVLHTNTQVARLR
jgi:hypothetical protein